MPQIASRNGMEVYMYYDDHNPPHFHVKYSGKEAVLTIGKRKLIAGSLPLKQLEEIKEWAKYHKLQLLHNWNLVLKGLKPKQIDPYLKGEK